MKRWRPPQYTLADQLEHLRLKLTFRATGAGLWDLNINTGELYCDDRWYEIIGHEREISPVTTLPHFKAFIHPDDVEAATAVDPEWVLSLLDKEDGYQAEYRIVQASGEVRWIRSVACVVRDEASGHLRAIGCVTDITEFRDGRVPVNHAVITTQHLSKTERAAEPTAATLPLRPLTRKEKECLVWVSEGKTAWETAVILGVSRRTVEFHLQNAMHKLDAANKVQAAFIAVSHKLLDDGP
jgi:DNA-binding CsgD family transcriptional regulator